MLEKYQKNTQKYWKIADSISQKGNFYFGIFPRLSNFKNSEIIKKHICKFPKKEISHGCQND
jgi:hypothetical protein